MNDSHLTLDIRLGRPHDVAVIQQFDEYVGIHPRRPLSVEAWVGAGQCWVVTEHQRLVGYGVLNYGFFDRGFISLIFVEGSVRRRGIGAALVNHLIGVCRTPEIFSSTTRSNVPMQRLLENLGFVPSGTIENLDPGDPELVYFKKRGPQS